ncbi:MAG: S1 family peptidase [Enterobacteriaceae bacterium]
MRWAVLAISILFTWIELPPPAFALTGVAISGGRDAERDEFPYFVAIAKKEDPPFSEEQFCGGVLIGSNWVLTAAHCLKNETPQQIVALLGLNMSPDIDPDYTPIEIAQFYPYAGPGAKVADAALLKLAQNVPDTFQPISLFPQVKAEKGMFGTIMGFGQRAPDVPAMFLQAATLPIVPTSSCRYFGYPVDSSIQFCAGFTNTYISPEPGDSGRPFISWWHGNPTLLGILSVGSRDKTGFNKDSWPSKFTRADFLYIWIRATMCEQGGPCAQPEIALMNRQQMAD